MNGTRFAVALALAGLSCGMQTTITKRGGLPPLDTSFLEDLALTRTFELGRPSNPAPTPDGKAVLFLRSPPRAPVQDLYELDVATQTARRLVGAVELLRGAEESLSPEERARRERQRVSTRGLTDFALSPDGTRLLVSLSGRLYVVGRADGKVRELATSPGTLVDPQFSPDGKRVSYVLGADVRAIDLETGKETAITRGGTAEVSHGLAEFVAQEEMNRYTGYWWSPDARFVAYEEADAREVEEWRVADPADPSQAPPVQRYPRPGKANVKVRLGVVSASGGETTWVKWDAARYPYLATVRWDKGGPLTLVVQDRRQREVAVLAADPATGGTTLLLTERDEAWVNLDQDVPRWLEDGSGFLWSTERNGAAELELRDPKGALLRVVVPADVGFAPSWEIRGHGIFGVDEPRRQVYVRASANPTERHVYRAHLDGRPPVPLTRNPGQHEAVISKDGSLLVVREDRADAMPRVVVLGADGRRITDLPSVAEEPKLRPELQIVKVGKEPGFWCSILRPRGFVAGRKLPVLLHVYGGPAVRIVRASMSQALVDAWRADQGFVVVSIDGRGTPGRGRTWERAIRGSFAKVPLEDQVTALKALAERFPELDLDRVGVAGWSFGGYLSALAVLRRPEIFKAGFAGAPVAEWRDYDTHYTEHYLGLLEENAAGYEESSLLTHAAGLSRPLLIVHGTSDDNVFFVHSLKLSNALFRAGKEHAVLPLAGFTHMVPDPVVKAQLESRLVRFFQREL
jgi:dipeptidyl-peptidase-4